MALDTIENLLEKRQMEDAWELYHENSKIGRIERHSRFAIPPSDAAIVSAMSELRRVKPYRDYPKLVLPMNLPAATRGIDEIMVGRATARSFGTGQLYAEELAKILFMAYGVTRSNTDTQFPRPFRTVPSGGALYPLEIYVLAERIDGIKPGLYHFDPEDMTLDVLRTGSELDRFAEYFMQLNLARAASAVLLVSAIFVRSTFKYGDRGYRFALLETGHIGQNVVLAAEGLNIAAAPIGGFIDREIDRALGLDGLNESVLYTILLGRRPNDSECLD